MDHPGTPTHSPDAAARPAPASGRDILNRVRDEQSLDSYRQEHWQGSFADYLDLVRETPAITRTAYQRLYDMILADGTYPVGDEKEGQIRYRFFDDPAGGGKDAIFGLTRPLTDFANTLKSAALGYGTERRVILLHGPVGSSKSTIARLLKKGLERYSRTDEGALYTFGWKHEEEDGETRIEWDPMQGEPLQLVPQKFREEVCAALNEGQPEEAHQVTITGEACPLSRFIFKERLEEAGGDWTKVMESVVVKRLLLSEADRIGIGTFQPKDEKNQDSTELTGDINFRKIAEYGSESDPRAFNFDGEFNVANRGMIEFIEVLKLDVAFLYDLLGASQEHKIKPKKFAQTDIDTVILGHSVAGDTPIPYRHAGRCGWTTLAGLHEGFADDCTGLEVLAHDFDRGRTDWTPVRNLHRHRFTGRMLTTDQRWGVVETTPNHSILDRDGREFFPEQRREVMAARDLAEAFLPCGVPETIDVAEGLPGFVGAEAVGVVGGGVMTKPPRPGWSRLNRPRFATQVRTAFDPVIDVEPLKDLLTVLTWFATEGHVNGRNGGVVISQADRGELERVRDCYARISTATGSIDAGAKTDSAWRLSLGSAAIAELCVHHCGELAANKRLPDFLFGLPTAYAAHVFNELMRTDGTRSVPPSVAGEVSAEYAASFFDYKTLSPTLAAQVGTLASMLGYDYSVYRQDRGERAPAYRVRFVSGTGKRGGRHTSFRPEQARLHERPAAGAAAGGEWVYDVECAGVHNFVCGVGGVVCHNTNEPEFRKLQSNEFMEALRDRTIKIDVPYVTRLKEEVKIYEKDYNGRRVKGKHIAPHTLEVAAMWALLTRLEQPNNAGLTLLQKLKLYNGKTLPGFTSDNVVQLRRESKHEGLHGISPRYVQDKISNALVNNSEATSLNPFMVLRELEEGLKHHSLIPDEEARQHYAELISVVKEEYTDVVKNEVQRAIAADEEALTRLCGNYIDNVKAYTQREKVKNKFTGEEEQPDERLMRSIEERIDIPEARKDDFRREIMNYIGALALDGKRFDYRTNERLQKALEMKLFEDQKDSIKLSSIVSNTVDEATQEKIDVVKARLIRDFGYDDESATDVLQYVASIFARGDAKGGER